jgi:tryptophan halogenase
MTADLFVDASGFRSVLLGQAFQEPFISYKGTLLCDRAVVGGWVRREEPIRPCTTAETMSAGWCWQIEHEFRINRGYVFASDFLTNAEAEDEFRKANPRVEHTRFVPFRTGRYERAWVKNVVAVGNASGFVEPLEATALGVICDQARALAETLADGESIITPTLTRQYNRQHALAWDSIRRFLAVHYRYNTRLDTPFWRACREHVDLAGAEEVVAYYQENGPTSAWRNMLIGESDPFGMEGYLALLVGQQVPCQRRPVFSQQEQKSWRQIQDEIRARAARAFSVAEALTIIRDPKWSWPAEIYHSARRF